MKLGAPEYNGVPIPDHYRYLEEFFADEMRAAGYSISRYGQEHYPENGRWAPDFLIEVRHCYVFADVKIRHRDYRDFLIESAPIHRALHDEHPIRSLIPWIFVLVADDPLELIGYILAEDAARNAGPYRNDHRGNGSGDWYHQIDEKWLTPFGGARPERKRGTP